MSRIIEVYKCAVLTAIAVLLTMLLQHTPIPITMEKVRAEKIRGWQNRVPLVNVQDGNITVDNLESPVPVEVQNEVEVTGSVEIERR